MAGRDLASPALALVTCEDVSVVHDRSGVRVVALDRVSVRVRAGERVVLWGRSGSGKSTLLHVLGGLLEPTSGSVSFAGRPSTARDRATPHRGFGLGIAYVFQGSSLLPTFTAIENLRFAARYAPDDDGPGPDELLALVGLETKGNHLPSELSGGEQQRVAIARALAQRPRLMLCDEPTGHLDTDTSTRILALIDALHERFRFALVVATHDHELVTRFDRLIELGDGRIALEESKR